MPSLLILKILDLDNFTTNLIACSSFNFDNSLKQMPADYEIHHLKEISIQCKNMLLSFSC